MADTTITALPAAGALDGTEPLETVQGGTSKKTLASAVGTYVRGLFTTTPATIAEGGTNAATAAAARTSLGLAIGTNVQAFNANLTTYAGIAPSANVQTLLGAADYAAFRTSLGLVIGTNVQAFNANLTTYAGITPSANVQTLLGSADYAAFRTSLGAISDATNDGTPFVRKSAAWTRTFVAPGYVSTNWYPSDWGLSVASGATCVASTIYFAPLIIYADVTITDLGIEVVTAVGSSNFQLAIYAMDATTKLPTGAALTSTASISGASAVAVSATLGSPLTLNAGMYWAAVNCDSALGFRAIAPAQGWTNYLVGSATLSDVAKASPGQLCWLVSQAFNTWPSVTPGGLTKSAAASNRLFVAFYKAQ